MTALSDKYIAGFLDADGSIRVDTNGRLWMEFSQKQTNDGVIGRIHGVLGGSLLTKIGRRRGTRTVATRLVLSGKRAQSVLNRIRKHLVVKAQKAENLLAQIEGRSSELIAPKVHPSRAWLAGYFDGDGMVSAFINSANSAGVRVSITTSIHEQRGIELVHKAFGGTLRQREGTARWECPCDAAKARKFLGFFAKHALVKREQIYFTLGCAAMGHFRDGETIVATLKALKTHPHRLNDLAAEVDVTGWLATVRDLPRKRGQWHDEAQVCSECSSSDLYAKGYCNRCYQRVNYRQKRQSG
jgi:hypothetical protein